MNQHYTPAPVVLHTPDGTPYYATPPQAAPLVLHQAPALLPAQAVQYPLAAPVSYLPAQVGGSGRDVWPARLLAGGIGVGAAGVGVGFLFQALATAATGLGFLAAVLALVWLLKSGHGSGGARGGGAVNVQVNVSNRNR